MSKPSANTYKKIEENVIDEDILNKKEKLLKEMKDSKIRILTTEESINKLKEGNSISSFRDIELDIMIGKDLKIQNEKLANRLKEILKEKQDFCLIGIPDEINKFENLTEESENFWINNMDRTRDVWLQYLSEDMQYCTSNISRLYIRRKDRSNCGKYFSMLKDIWKDKNVLICEGNQSKIGVGNDLLDGCKSIKRVICSSEDIFSKYDEILKRIKEESKDTLILISLDSTSTVLAYDLAKEGYQALDLGHFDTEYELYRRKSNKERIGLLFWLL